MTVMDQSLASRQYKILVQQWERYVILLIMSQSKAANQSSNISSPRKPASRDNPQADQSMRQTRSRALRSKTQDIYVEYHNPPRAKKRKFIEHSIFLPVISKQVDRPRNNTDNKQDHSENEFDRNLYGSGAQSRYRSKVQNYSQPTRHQYYDRQNNEQFGTTMKYINECEKIIIHLRNLTDQSEKKLRKRHQRTSSTANELYDNEFQLDQNAYEITPRSNIHHHKRHESNNKQVKLKAINDTITTRPNQQKYQRVEQQISSRAANKNKVHKKNTVDIENGHARTNKQDSTIHRQMSETMLKLEEENRKAETRQKIFMKFLGKARNRGIELERKILNFKKKKSQQKQHMLKQADEANNKKDQKQSIMSSKPNQNNEKSKR